MFKFEVSPEEEVLLEQLLDNEKVSRLDMLYEIKSLISNSNNNSLGLVCAKTLFQKIKNTSDYEFNEYISLLLL